MKTIPYSLHVTSIIPNRELLQEHNSRFVHIGIHFTFTQTKYPHISLLVKQIEKNIYKRAN